MTLPFCVSGKMSSRKRERDEEYQYELQETPVRPSSGYQADGGNFTQVPIPLTNTSDYVANLLELARMSRLLPPQGAQMNTSFSPIAASSIPNPFQSNPFTLPGYGQKPDSRQADWKNNQDRIDPKRRKLNNSKPSRNRKTQQPKDKTKSSPSKCSKPPHEDSLVSNLITEALSNPTGPNVPSINSIPLFPSIRKPDGYPPPLPPIHNKALEKQCFTHPSYVHDPTNKTNATSAMHYERLEFLGDSYMNYCVTKILFNKFPQLREGELTGFRSQIISNQNIRHYAMMYGFPERILLSTGAEKDDVREQGKKVADIFEAYIGGILTDQAEDGERVVFEWMSKVVAPQVDAAESVAKTILNLNKNAKQELYVLVDAEKAPAPTYVVTKQGSTNTDFEVACMIQGKEAGRGIGKNKQEAGIRAAMQVLERLRTTRAKKEEENDLGDNKVDEDKEANNDEDNGKEDEWLSEGEINVSLESSPTAEEGA